MLQNTIARIVCPLAMSGFAFAQTVTTSVAALTPLPCSVVVGTQTISQTVPAGPLANFGWAGAHGAGTALESAQLAWQAGAGSTDATFRLHLSTNVSSGNVAHVGAGEILFTFAGAGPVAMPARYLGGFQVAGSGASQLRVDVGNDGTIDWSAGAGPLAGVSADLVAQPLQIRVLFDHLAAAPGASEIELELRIVPDNGIHVLPLATDCGIANEYAVGALWATTYADLELRARYTAWHVLGFTSQPQLLPTSLTMTGMPCLVVPSTDLVLRTGTWFVPIPPVLRPITLHVQLVDIVPFVRVSDAFAIVAL